MIANTTDADRPAKATYESLIESFGQAWERGDAEAMAQVFTAEGVFLPDPFDTPVRGREAIAAYWRDLPKRQADITFRWGEVFVAGPWFSVEYKVAFRRRRTGEEVVVRGALFCETAEGLVSEMRMYWHRNVDR